MIQLTFITPIEFKSIASTVAKATDPDIGGHENFNLIAGSNDTGTYCVASVSASESMFNSYRAMLANPNLLHSYCLQQYAARWQDFTPPTLADCTVFAESTKLIATEVFGQDLASILAENGLKLIYGTEQTI